MERFLLGVVDTLENDRRTRQALAVMHFKCEYVDGLAQELAGAPRHHERLRQAFENAYRDAHGGVFFNVPIDIVFSEHNVVQPDVVYFRPERRHVVHDWEATRAAPDLAVEVVSRSTEARDRGRKMEMLARFGVHEYWIVDPKQNTIEIYLLAESTYELAGVFGAHEEVRSSTLPDLAFQTARVFAE